MSVIATARSAARHRRMSRLEMAAYIARLEGQNAALTAENTWLGRQLDRAAVDYSGALYDLDVVKAEAARLHTVLAATQARLANATAVNPLPQHVTTQPIPAIHRFETGPVLRAGVSPLAAVTDPGQAPRTTTWGRANDDTQPLPKQVAS
ncbi:hypothetical protein ACIRF8_15085 [Streptomyces sp. NPDC102406]|uniref:hypothetical protein n=1 Tax=Streptomyces sp. NPDC102406 TaxID=3366171 RepID=UPI00381547FF